MTAKTALLLVLAVMAQNPSGTDDLMGVSQNLQVANYYYGVLAPLDRYATFPDPKLMNGEAYNGQFAYGPKHSFGNPSGVFPHYVGPANNYYGGSGSNGIFCDPKNPSCMMYNRDPSCQNGTTTPTTADCSLAKNSNNGFGGLSAATSCPCTNVYNPVCSSAGVTYANYCRAVCHGASVVTQGPCYSFNFQSTCNSPCQCPDVTSLVCSNAGVTYENNCVALCAKASVASNSMCALPCNCQYSYAPVCSKTGKNYVNLCFLNCAKEELLFNGKCSDYKPDVNPCTKCDNTLNPVCGQDGKTYPNECQLTCQNKTSIRYVGECPTYPNGQCTCSNNYLPVCSKDGQTFNNYCGLYCANKVFAYMGPCMTPNSIGANGYNPACLANCANHGWNPLCGTDGFAYGNQCAMTCKLSGAVSPVKAGPCDPVVNSFCTCDSTINLVCGADGKTYLNTCQLNCVSVSQKSVGPCEAIGNYGSVLAYFQQYGIGANFVNANGYSILEKPHVFIPGPFDQFAGRKKPKSNYDDDSSSRKKKRPSSKYDDDSDSRRGRGKGFPGAQAGNLPTGPFTLIGSPKNDNKR